MTELVKVNKIQEFKLKLRFVLVETVSQIFNCLLLLASCYQSQLKQGHSCYCIDAVVAAFL
jgi:hypothetical protein